MKHHLRLIAVGACAVALVLVASAQLANASKSSGVAVTVRVEGLSSTLLPETTVTTKAASIDKDGKPADVCEGDTAAVALQDATKGAWAAGTFSSGLGYPVVGIKGVSYPFTSSYYWSFWIDGRPATTGICGATLKAGDRLLFFPQCSSETASSCPGGTFDPPVLDLRGPTRARVGKAITVHVASLANLSGIASPASGVKLVMAGHKATTGASGKAKLTFTKAGTYRIVASEPGSVRDELTIKVSR